MQLWLAPGLQGDYAAHLSVFVNHCAEGHSESRPFWHHFVPSPNISTLNISTLYPFPEEGEGRVCLGEQGKFPLSWDGRNFYKGLRNYHDYPEPHGNICKACSVSSVTNEVAPGGTVGLLNVPGLQK